jgi:hypothetical protein
MAESGESLLVDLSYFGRRSRRMTDEKENKDYEVNVVLLDNPLLITVMLLAAYLFAAGLYKTGEMIFWVMR